MWRKRNASISHQNLSKVSRDGKFVKAQITDTWQRHSAEMSLLLLRTFWQPALRVCFWSVSVGDMSGCSTFEAIAVKTLKAQKRSELQIHNNEGISYLIAAKPHFPWT